MPGHGVRAGFPQIPIAARSGRGAADAADGAAESRVRYGYRRLHVLLQREGWQINHKRTYRLYNEEGLSIRTRSPRRRRACRYRAGRFDANAMNDVWGEPM